jgi:hypothetical protein
MNGKPPPAIALGRAYSHLRSQLRTVAELARHQDILAAKMALGEAMETLDEMTRLIDAVDAQEVTARD